MAKKMLIDATHPEETRVVVADGNKVEEFDFESLNKRQLAGNIYLAKVTRVEPSLQAAFVDYGGNRHGFLAFSEIHPDYYQIPKADRDAILAEERAFAEAQAVADDEAAHKARAQSSRDDEGEAEAEGVEASEEEAPKKSRSRSRSRSRSKKATADTPTEAQAGDARDGDGDRGDAPADAAEALAEEARDDTVIASGSNAETSEAAAAPSVEAEQETPSGTDDSGTDEGDRDDGGDRVTSIAEDSGLEDRTLSEGDDGAIHAEDAEAAARPEPAGMETVDLGSADDRSGGTQDDAPQGEGAPAAGDGDAGGSGKSGRGSRSSSRKSGGRKAASDKDADVETVADDDEPDEIRPPRKPRMRKYKIQEVVKVRQIMLVQVVKEERGNKGAALTTYLSLAGRYCVLMPNTARGGGISRKITNTTDRKKLKDIAAEIEVPTGAGLIIRTAGAKRTKTEIKRDYEYLQRQWEQVRELTLRSIAPAPIYEEGNLIHRSIRDLYTRDIDEVLVDGEAGYRHAKDYMKLIMPSHAKNVKRHEGAQSLFAKHGVEAYLSSMFNPTVQLKSGGYIVIGITEALVAVDVNSGKATKEGSIEETALKTNLEAADEVARQCKLRDLAGLIVVDFIDMDERKNNAAVEKRIKDALKNDRARIQVGRISGFGLLEMSRQRLRPGMLEATTQACPHCHGTGLIRSDDSVALQILRALEEEGGKKRSREVLLKLPVDICNYLMNEKREHLAMVEARYGMAVRVQGEPSMVAPDYQIEKFKTATRVVPKAAVAAIAALDASSWDDSEDDVVEEAEVEAPEASDQAEEATRGGRAGEEDRPDGEGAPKKKRRRRSRRKKPGNDEGTNGHDGEAEATDGGDESAPTDTGEDADAQPQPEAAAEASGGSEPEAAADAKPAPKSRSRSRSRSRSKKAEPVEVAETPEQAEVEVQTPAEPGAVMDEASGPVGAEDRAAPDAAETVASAPAKKQRTRARAPAPTSDATSDVNAVADPVEDGLGDVAEAADAALSTTSEASTPAPQSELAIQPEPASAEAVPEAETPTTGTPVEDEKPKKKGWWSFGG